MQKKKVMAILLSAAIAASTFIGCGTDKAKDYKDTDTVMFIDKDNKIDYATACTYTRMMQAETYSYMQSMLQRFNSSAADVDMWSQSLEDTDEDSKKYKTYGEQFKGNILDALASLLQDKLYDSKEYEYKTYGEQFKGNILDALASLLLDKLCGSKEYEVTFTDDDKKECESVADEFIEKMSKDDLKAMHASKKTMMNVLELMTYETRVKNAIESDVDTKVSDDEAGQSTFSYVEIKKKDAKKKEKKIKSLIKKVEAGTDISAAASDAGFTAQSVTFTTADPEYDEYGKEMLKKVSKMKDGECDSYKDAKGNTIILYMQSVNDQSATETKKDDIISDRKDKAYEDKLDEWKDKKKVTINKDAWNSIKTDKNEVFQRMETEENSSDSDDSTGTTVANSDDSDTSVSVSSSDTDSEDPNKSNSGDSDNTQKKDSNNNSTDTKTKTEEEK
ncbi:hypothetical protein [Blautia massiliensis (ex Durand et al. 2017)]|uniref:hypothetical protein n=1 Tax=Blautia massiliensis (ex Durand et al. 2017) TaxID=1737424 RepID=UPI0018A0F9EF|nr:hypothetical protein [Blautia massiliensis (ex Durand et al. 2017)]